MIYNGVWTGSTCANAGDLAQTGRSTFSGGTSNQNQIVRIGYTYVGEYASKTRYSHVMSYILGDDLHPQRNNNNSSIKYQVENYYSSHLLEYTSILEPSAGYCNDRSVYNYDSPYTLWSGSSNIVTYSSSEQDSLRFGASIRNDLSLLDNDNKTITLGCMRDIVDLYTTADATDGNKQLSQPAALLTADEVSLAGTGSMFAQRGSSYNEASYLVSGSLFATLSPAYRAPSGRLNIYRVTVTGFLSNSIISEYNGIRPAISLKPGTEYISGSGTATDPWIVPAP